MIELDAKLERPETTPHTLSRRRLSTLRGRIGWKIHDGSEARPMLVSICPMDRRSYWRRVDGDMDKDPQFQLEREEKESHG